MSVKHSYHESDDATGVPRLSHALTLGLSLRPPASVEAPLDGDMWRRVRDRTLFSLPNVAVTYTHDDSETGKYISVDTFGFPMEPKELPLDSYASRYSGKFLEASRMNTNMRPHTRVAEDAFFAALAENIHQVQCRPPVEVCKIRWGDTSELWTGGLIAASIYDQDYTQTNGALNGKFRLDAQFSERDGWKYLYYFAKKRSVRDVLEPAFLAAMKAMITSVTGIQHVEHTSTATGQLAIGTSGMHTMVSYSFSANPLWNKDIPWSRIDPALYAEQERNAKTARVSD